MLDLLALGVAEGIPQRRISRQMLFVLSGYPQQLTYVLQ
jgi:hypothetical protein